MKTDKQLLVKGLKALGYAAAAMFLGPFLLYEAFRNQEHPFFIPVLVLGLGVAVGAIYLGFRAVHLVVEAMFGKKSKP